MAEFPALPLFTDAYMADCSHLTYEEHGMYLMLLMTIWRNPNQRVPNDNEWLARRMRLSVSDVATKLRPLISEFCKTDGNWITQKRLDREWTYVRNLSEKNSEKAKSRWNKKKSVCSGNAPTPTPHIYNGNGEVSVVSAGELARLSLAKKGIPNISNTPQDFDKWVASGELTIDQARKAGASI